MEPERWNRIERFYHAALEHEPGGRAAFLVEACPDADLRREVESLLGSDGSDDSMLEHPAWSRGIRAGERLGPYEVLERIGKGGMGEVWRARDPRLNREVAIKISAHQFSDRFEREARSIAALNHSHICTLFDVGPNYLVMELVEGATLAERIAQGPLPLDEALAVARQIADALETAHEKNIVHRDLKPANIKIKPDGSVKVLDFGLAKPAEQAELTSDSPTMLSVAGMILGTAGYMAPEQARGKVVDKRADIWAFGVVLYEMVTGKRPFEGETTTEILSEVIKAEPSWNSMPPRAQRLLKSCLKKDPKKRLRDIGDAWQLLEDGPESAPPSRSRLAWGVAAVLALIAGVALWAPWRVPPHPAERPLVRLDVDLGPEISLRPLRYANAASSVIISPDGTRLVYVASVSGSPQKLFARRLDQSVATELPGTEGATFPFFSPDGQWVGFATLNKLNKISVEGGAVVPLGDINVYGANWGEDGNIIADGLAGRGMVLIPSRGGAATPATELASGELVHGYPQILPGGKAMLFTVGRGPDADIDKGSIEVFSFADRRRKTLVRGGTSPHYVASSDGAGHLVYSNRGTLFAIPFDLNGLETRGSAIPVLDGVAYEPIGGAAHFDVSRTGTLVYRQARGARAGTVTTVQWLDAVGRKEPLLARGGTYDALRLSPDGKRLAVQLDQEVWIYDRQRDAMTRLTFGGSLCGYPIWSPDGRYVAFYSGVLGGVFWTRADGAGHPQPLAPSGNSQYPASFSPDGKRLAYFEGNYASGTIRTQIWTVPVEENGDQLRAGKPEQFIKTQFTDVWPMFSPDGQWLAYQSNESGMDEVYVRAFPLPASGQGDRWQISNSGGKLPVWSRNGRELLYQSGDRIMAVNYTVKGASFLAEKPRVWAAKLGGATWFDLAPDGKRLAVLAPADTPEATQADHEVTFIFNFPDELRRRVPPGKP